MNGLDGDAVFHVVILAKNFENLAMAILNTYCLELPISHFFFVLEHLPITVFTPKNVNQFF